MNDEQKMAFPCDVHNGMLLRDYFAAAVMPRIVQMAIDDEAWQAGDDWHMQTAVTAYRWADFMLKAREITNE